jgi:hypothetical protein
VPQAEEGQETPQSEGVMILPELADAKYCKALHIQENGAPAQNSSDCIRHLLRMGGLKRLDV